MAYCVDVSPSMSEPMADPDGTGIKRPKLAWVKEYVAREFEPKVNYSSARKGRLTLFRSKVDERQTASDWSLSAAVSPLLRSKLTLRN